MNGKPTKENETINIKLTELRPIQSLYINK